MKRALIFFAICAAGCARSQWLVQVSTDADTPTWGDRLLIEVLDDSGNVMGTLDSAVTDADFPVSFGVVPPSNGAIPRVRARLYHSELVDADGLPTGTQLIDTVALLPALDGSGDTSALMILGDTCYAQPADVPNHMSCQYAHGFGAEVALPSFSITRGDPNDSLYLPGYIAQFAVACPDLVDGMVCVTSVPFLLGETDSDGVDSDYPTSPVVLQRLPSSHLLDVDEFTVGQARAFIASGKIPSSQVLRRGDPGVPETCTYLGSGTSTNDSLPLNCISRQGASDACLGQGKKLPLEALWEMAARNGVKETRYPWGEDPSDCTHAVVSADASCLQKGPAPIDTTTLDVNDVGVRNLGGNLSEWVDGIFVPYTDACWNDPAMILDCAGTDSRYYTWRGPWPYRGGSWNRRASSAAGFARFASPDGSPSPSIGFRCAM